MSPTVATAVARSMTDVIAEAVLAEAGQALAATSLDFDSPDPIQVEGLEPVNELLPGWDDLMPSGSMTVPAGSGALQSAAEAVTRYSDATLVAEFGARMREAWAWTPGMGWLYWQTPRWTTVHEAGVDEYLRDAMVDLFHVEISSIWKRYPLTGDMTPDQIQEVQRQQQQAVKAATVLKTEKKITSVRRMLRGHLGVDDAMFDAPEHAHRLTVGNGVVDLTTGLLHEPNPDWHLTRMTDVKYRPDATHEDWTAALAAVDGDVADYLQVRFGQACTGETVDDDRVLFLLGAGSNGKSTILSAIDHALGEHAHAGSDRLLLANTGAHETYLADLKGVRLVYLEELPEGRYLEGSRLKKVSGTERISARKMRQDQMTFAATHTMFVSSNHTPAVAETDGGTWRRLQAVRFVKTFVRPGAPTPTTDHLPGDPQLRNRLMRRTTQQEAVLAWLIAGARRWYQTSKVMPEAPRSVQESTEEWRQLGDEMAAFWSENLESDPDSCITTDGLFRGYQAWAIGRGGKGGVGKQTFTDRFREHRETVGAGVRNDRPASGTIVYGEPGSQGVSASRDKRSQSWLNLRWRDQDAANGGLDWLK